MKATQKQPALAKKSALIVEGGAMRGIFSIGVLDSFIEAGFYPFDYYFGVSAGASNLAAYLGKKHKRNYKIYTDYCLRPEFKSFSRFLKGGNYIDIDWLWDITERELCIGKPESEKYFGRFFVVATCKKTGEAHYLTPTSKELFTALKASGNMPFAYKGEVALHGKNWSDGGVADSIPVQKAYDMGARRIMIIRSNPYSYIKKPYRLKKIFPLLLKNEPEIANILMQRHKAYNQTLEFIRNPPEDCKIIEICPPETFKAGQFTTDLTILNESYQEGVVVGKDMFRKYKSIFEKTSL